MEDHICTGGLSRIRKRKKFATLSTHFDAIIH